MISFQNVSKSFGPKKVLDKLSFTLGKGKLTFIVGKSGEGKSVTIKHIIGLLKPDSGQVLVDGTDVGALSKHEMIAHRQRFGMLFQQAALFDSMSVEQNIMFPLREHFKLSQRDMKERVSRVLEEVGLPAILDKFPSELSTGEKKRVGLARALIAKPHILLYDEPTTGMDPLICEMIDNLIVKVNEAEKEMTSIVISHDLKATLATADHIVMLYKGRVAMEGTPDEFRSTKDPIVRQFFSGKVEGPMEFV